MIHKKKEFSPDAFGRLNYAAGGKGHEHKVEHVDFIQGTMLSELKFKISDRPILGKQSTKPGHGPVLVSLDDFIKAIPEVSATDDNSSATDDETGASTLTVDFSDLEDEFNAVASMHCGKGENLFGHYIISLAPGETLTNEQWDEVMKEYMDAMGYDEFTKFCGFRHSNTDNDHLHIVTCRVRLEKGGRLVDDSNDYEKGMKAMRGLEKKFGLQIVANPEETWGVDRSKGDFYNMGGSREAIAHNGAKNSSKDWGAVIRGRVNEAWNKGRPRDMSELVKSLMAVGVDVKIRTNTEGEPRGISYRAHGSDVWMSGSNVKAARLTWQNLTSKEGIKYNAFKDNEALGLPPPNGVLIRVDGYQHLNRRQVAVIKKTKLPVRIYRRGPHYFAGLGFEQILQSGKERYEQMVHDQLFKLVLALLNILFGTDIGKAPPPIMTQDHEVPEGMDEIRNDVDTGGWEVPESDGNRLSVVAKKKITEELSGEIYEVHNEWIDPKFEIIGKTLDNDDVELTLGKNAS